MNRAFTILLSAGLLLSSCEVLDPKPIDVLTDDVVLNEAKDVPTVEIGLYSAFRPIVPSMVIAGDCTSDMLIHNGTFSQYRELGNKQITSANASATALWGSIYNTIYIANFIIERLDDVPGVTTAVHDRVMGTAHFLRGYSYFVALTTYGGVPLVTTTDIEVNRNIARSSVQDVTDFILDDFQEALSLVPPEPTSTAFVGEFVVRAAMAKYYLYLRDWANAELSATQVINSGLYTLEPDFETLVLEDFTDEAIFEVGYTIADDPGTNSTIGLNNLFLGRREIIPSNQAVVALASVESGDRFTSIVFDAGLLSGSDNGWSVAKYGTADEDNNNVVVMRLGEMYLIRAEARAQQNDINGSGGAQGDINILRTRANAPTVGSVTQSKMLQLLEEERLYELAYEGRRWYDLVRTDRAKVVMPAFNANWRDAYELWPIPQREINNNPALVGNQNPGY